MATCRVYLCTYRRNDLLPRALNSLLSQRFTDWVCEVHNDDPSDPFPGQLVKQIGDPRIIMIDHEKNLGPTQTFNLVFRPVAEQYVSLLEDDNWWEPDFLERMVGLMNQHPEVNVSWANMYFWRQEEDGSWTKTGKCIWERPHDAPIEFFERPQPRQIMGALHSNGAMLVRSAGISNYIIPAETPFAVVEPVRERCFNFPLLFVPEPLANFAVTRQTARSKDVSNWGQVQALLAASFFRNVPVAESTWKDIWHEARSKPARSTCVLFFASIINPGYRSMLRHASVGDWAFFVASSVKHPLNTFQILWSRTEHKQLWDFLNRRSASWCEEAQTQGFECL
jgi:glycosyltransferase involved in cell wall biosynthesis